MTGVILGIVGGLMMVLILAGVSFLFFQLFVYQKAYDQFNLSFKNKFVSVDKLGGMLGNVCFRSGSVATARPPASSSKRSMPFELFRGKIIAFSDLITYASAKNVFRYFPGRKRRK